jgi:hypothetical protein
LLLQPSPKIAQLSIFDAALLVIRFVPWGSGGCQRIS